MGFVVEPVVDLRSDTVTVPTPEMREAMATAEVGNSAYGEDPTVNELQARMAEVLGKEQALFLPSGTMGNQAALLAWTSALEDPLRGAEVVLEEQAHIVQWESAGLSRIAGAQARTLPSDDGAIDPQALAAALRGPEAAEIKPGTACVCTENTHNHSGGTVVPRANLEAVAEVAASACVPVHLDGARLFNAAVASGEPPDTIAGTADSVMVSLSKGLACPVGSVLAGTSDFIARARSARALLGGAMRQAGVLAACGLVALETMVDRLAEDHANARHLAEALASIEGIELAQARVDTNIVYVDVAGLGTTPQAFCDGLADRGVLMDDETGGSLVRAVTHKDVTRGDVDRAAELAAQVAAGIG